MMKKGTVAALMLIVVAGVLLSDLQLAQGLKCWACLKTGDCTKENPTEYNCTEDRTHSRSDEPFPFSVTTSNLTSSRAYEISPLLLKHDHCFKETYRAGKIGKGCVGPYLLSSLEKEYKCNEFGGPSDAKVCFCTGDLCNDAPMLTGYFKRQLILSSVASVAVYFIVHLLL